jgi:hypothetical protein
MARLRKREPAGSLASREAAKAKSAWLSPLDGAQDAFLPTCRERLRRLALGTLRAIDHGLPSDLVREQDVPRLAGSRRPARTRRS